MKGKSIIEQNEIRGNQAAANVMGITECIFLLIYILNVLGIFIVKEKAMNLAFITGTILLVMPMIMNHFIDNSNPKLKYIYVLDASLFLLVVVSILSFHVVIVYVYPVLISCLYFSRRLTWIATALTASFVTIGQFASFFNQYVVDKNFDTIRNLIVFGIIPRALVLVALACVLGTMTNSTSRLLAEQQAAMQKILTHQQDMITGFALLAENRDEVSGKHVQCVSMYTEVLARAMQKRGLYPKVLTDDYIECLISSTKLHDIGRISVSDAVLQKPGKLTESEFELVKLHTTKGGEIISQTLKSDDEDFQKMAYEVAMYHHERWNGRGYPEELRETMIPLSARIVAICDVFEAISSKRCYRDAMPLDKCFEIIRRGRGVDFDPMMVDIFLDCQEQISEIYHKELDEVI